MYLHLLLLTLFFIINCCVAYMFCLFFFFFFFFFNDTATTEIYTLSLHDALPISAGPARSRAVALWSATSAVALAVGPRSEEHTSELQSRRDLVCRLLLEKKKRINRPCIIIIKK